MGRATKYNKITSPELLAQVNPENMRLKEDFLAYLKSIQRSEGTRKGYSNDLDIVMVYILQRCGNKKFIDVKKREFIAMQTWLIEENGNSPARVRRIKAVISSLTNFITNILADDEPEEFGAYRPQIRAIENPVNTPVREKTVLTDEQCQLVLDTLVETKQYDKACLFALGAYSGRRKAELVRFKVSYFDDSNIIYGSLYKTPEKILTKGNKYLSCYVLAREFKPYFDLWMQERERIGLDSEWLFPNPRSPEETLSIATVNKWTDVYSKIAGVPVYMHALRHRFCTDLSKSGLPNDIITEIIGWSSESMCKIYVDRDADDRIGEYFDEGGIKQVEKTKLSDL